MAPVRGVLITCILLLATSKPREAAQTSGVGAELVEPGLAVSGAVVERAVAEHPMRRGQVEVGVTTTPMSP
jgi:hypothetical protein